MSFSFNFRMFFAAAAALILTGTTAQAQGFGLSVSSSANSILVSNTVTYTMTVANLTGVTLSSVEVISALPTSVQITGEFTSQGTNTVTGSVVVFNLGLLVNNEVAQLNVSAQPTVAGFITNMVSVSATGVNTAATNVVILVTNTVIQSDLGVAMTAPAQPIITGDLMTYGVTATNLGPDAVPGVILTNTLPPGILFIGVSPTNQTYTVASSNLIFNLGTLADGGYANLQFTVQPTNAGTLTFSASVGAPSLVDNNPANNSASTNVTVINSLPGQLVAVTNSPQIYNMQNNLVEQSITVTNIGTNTVPAVRVVVTGLSNQLFNAVGTNNENPFVVYGSSLAAGQNVELLLQYAANNYFPFTNSQLQALAVPVPDLTPPPAMLASTNIHIISIVQLSSGSMLIWFPSISNRTYTVVYNNDLSSTNWLMAQPSVVAPTTFTEWIDYGPPTTLSAPANTSARFYRVYLNP
jgi:uncharacterized repeat protein (TIGR01451 family)